MDINRLQKQLGSRTDKVRELPPVENWNPPFCGDIDIVIDRSGQWHYNQSPISRASLVNLFSSVLKKEGNDYFLVTPVEKVGIRVQDVPFIIAGWQWEDKKLVLNTLQDDRVVVGNNHPVELRFSASDNSAIPYVNVRRNLWARLHQNVYYQLLSEATETKTRTGTLRFTLQSGDYTVLLGEVSS
ncbi:DUF1285 domain-containing protein [Aestuariibacter sp. A3R04]|uniref:DUF1285 domain-containing protein n=1 Tax=Aestuariibacter sp. A3R04 TaxID=2841571 RepID=UPI001C089B49|nr:DUF1285 domain-containing protein [Aestuariibacter sp. A3R04]MBU3020276.1 DUF1285 domain-containing protein [Aestuariibacter sp. A3R04]